MCSNLLQARMRRGCGPHWHCMVDASRNRNKEASGPNTFVGSAWFYGLKRACDRTRRRYLRSLVINYTAQFGIVSGSPQLWNPDAAVGLTARLTRIFPDGRKQISLASHPSPRGGIRPAAPPSPHVPCSVDRIRSDAASACYLRDQRCRRAQSKGLKIGDNL